MVRPSLPPGARAARCILLVMGILLLVIAVGNVVVTHRDLGAALLFLSGALFVFGIVHEVDKGSGGWEQRVVLFRRRPRRNRGQRR